MELRYPQNKFDNDDVTCGKCFQRGLLERKPSISSWSEPFTAVTLGELSTVGPKEVLFRFHI